MLTDYISPGIRVELKAAGKVWMDEDTRTRHIYMSKVMDGANKGYEDNDEAFGKALKVEANNYEE